MDVSSVEHSWASAELIDILRYHVNPTLRYAGKTVASCRLVCRAWCSAVDFATLAITPEAIRDNTLSSLDFVKKSRSITFYTGDSSSLEWFRSVATPQNSFFVSLALMFPQITEQDSKFVCELLSLKWSHLRSFRIHATELLRADRAPSIAEAIAITPNSLESISFSFCSMTDEVLAILLSALHRNKTVRRLDLSNCALTETSGDAIINFIENNRTITWLNLADNYNLEWNPILLRDAVAFDTTLRELNMSFCRVEDSLYGAFDRNHTLRSFNGNAGAHPGDSLPSIFATLQRNSGLRKLNIGFNSTCDNTATVLGDFFKTNTTLQKLAIQLEGYRELDFNPMFIGLAANSALTSLDVSDFASTYAEHLAIMIENHEGGFLFRTIAIQHSDLSISAPRLFRALALLPRLEKLNFHCSDLGPVAADGLAALVDTSTSLKKLFLFRCGLEDEGLMRLCAAASRNSNLRQLSIGGDRHEEPVFVAICDLIAKSSSLERLDFSGSYIPIKHKPMFDEALARSYITKCDLLFSEAS
jgi:hypothetical protein